MAKTAVVSKADGLLIKVISTAAEKKEFEGQDVDFVTAKTFTPTEKYASFDEMIGKVKPMEGGDDMSQAGANKGKRGNATPLEGAYHLLKPLPPTADDHPKKPIWNAIVENNGGTVEAAKAACPAENPKRRTNGVYTFASEFRYFLKAGYVAMGEIPEGFDYTHVEPKPAKEPKAKKAKKSEATENAASDGAESTQEQSA